jgi:hypothetical protein
MSLTPISSKKTFHSKVKGLIKSLAFSRGDDAPMPKASFGSVGCVSDVQAISKNGGSNG